MIEDINKGSMILREYLKNINTDSLLYLNLGGTLIPRIKKGNKIHIKKANRGKFTDYCNGKVTNECIAKGKRSSNPVIRKRATFAQNARKWHKK